jgi:hypothetical protein
MVATSKGINIPGLVLALVLAAYVLDESPFSVFFALKDHHVRCLHLDQFPN